MKKYENYFELKEDIKNLLNGKDLEYSFSYSAKFRNHYLHIQLKEMTVGKANLIEEICSKGFRISSSLPPEEKESNGKFVINFVSLYF